MHNFQMNLLGPRLTLNLLRKFNRWHNGGKANLSGINTDVKDIANQINEAKNVLVMTGAGLSTPSGIPDFRTPGTGIYDNLKKYNLPYPEAIFDINYYRIAPQAFNTWAKEFLPGVNYRPNKAHFFLRLLHERGQLARLYTQNIDGLEALAGIPAEKIVHSHGSFTNRAKCVDCGEERPIEEVRRQLLKDETPKCSKCGSPVKPDIVFFGEMLPDSFWNYESDAALSDLLICVGTSLEVLPFAGIADAFPIGVPRLLLNMHLVGSFGSRGKDSFLSGDLVDSVDDLVKAMGCENQLESLMQEHAIKD